MILPKNVKDMARDRIEGSVVYLSSCNNKLDKINIIKLINQNRKLVYFKIGYGKRIREEKLVKRQRNYWEQEISIRNVLDNLRIKNNGFSLKEWWGNFLFRYSLSVARAESLGAEEIILPLPLNILKKVNKNVLLKKLYLLANKGTSKGYNVKIKILEYSEPKINFKPEKVKHHSKTYIGLVSGGTDSIVANLIYNKLFYKNLEWIMIDYNQSARYQEWWCVKKLAKDFAIKKLIKVHLNALKYFGGSALLNDKIKITEKNLSVEYVPFRNTIFIFIAVLRALKINSDGIIFGAQRDDSLAPDGSEEYVKIFNSLLKFLNLPEIKAPLLNIGGKPELIKIGSIFGINWDHTWSCHDFVAQSKAGCGNESCGRCANCITRYSSFNRIGSKDPLGYKKIPIKRKEWKGQGRDYLKILSKLKKND